MVRDTYRRLTVGCWIDAVRVIPMKSAGSALFNLASMVLVWRMSSVSHHAGFRSILLSVLLVTLGLWGASPCRATGLYVFRLSGHTVSTSALLPGTVTIGDPYTLHLGFEISEPDRSSDPTSFTSVTPDAVWHLGIGKHFSRSFAAGTSFELREQPGRVQQFDVRNLHPITLGGVEFPADSFNALRIGGITLADPYPSHYTLGTVLDADYNAPGGDISRFIIGELPDPAFLGTIERISLAPEYFFSSVPETGTFALGALTLVAAAAMLRTKRRRKFGC